MEPSSAHPSTVFSVATRRHITEEGALVKAVAMIYEKLDLHRVESPKTVVVSLETKTYADTGYGYGARASVVVRYLIP